MGRDEYEFTTAALRDAGYLRALKIVIAVLCLAMAVLGWLMQLHPLGPQGPVARMLLYRVKGFRAPDVPRPGFGRAVG